MQASQASHPTTPTLYRPDIDGLRAIAVLLVVVFHFHLTSESKSGFVGVDIFFVISGYLITRIVREQMQTGRFSLGNFWVKRLRRLAPALFVVLLGVTTFGAFRLLQGDFKQLMHEVLAAQFYVANIYFWQNVNYFGLQAGNIYLLHTWSLAVEEQFYILYPLSLVAALRFAPRSAFLLVLAAALSSFALNLSFVDSKPQATFYLMPTRAWELLIGAMLTWAPPLRHKIMAHVLGVAGGVLIVGAVAGYTEDTPFPGYFALLPTLGAACLIYSGHVAAAWSTQVLSLRPLVYIGQMSYSLYLVHWPVNVFAAHELGENYTLPWRMAMVVLCLVLAALMLRRVENPFRHGTWLGHNRRFLSHYAAGLAASVAVAAIVIGTQGLPGRLPTEVARLAAFADDKPDGACAEFRPGLAAPTQDLLCPLGTPNQAAEWLIWGDSHAWAAQGALDQWLKAAGTGGRIGFLNSCPPLRDVSLYRTSPGCVELNQRMLTLAATDAQVKKVFLVSTWRQALEGKLTQTPGQKPTVESSIALFQRQFDTTVRELRAMGKEVFIWEPLPGATDFVPRRLAAAELRGTTARLEHRLIDYRSEYAFFFSALQRQGPGVRSFSTSAELCSGEFCAVVVGKRPVYFDNSHLAHSGSGFWAAALQRQLGQPRVAQHATVGIHTPTSQAGGNLSSPR